MYLCSHEIVLLVHWPSSCNNTRLQEVALVHLRIGHTFLNHSFLMSHDPPPKCSFCSHDILLSVYHILLQRHFFAVLRRQIFPLLNSVSPRSTTDFFDWHWSNRYDILILIVPLSLPFSSPSILPLPPSFPLLFARIRPLVQFSYQ